MKRTYWNKVAGTYEDEIFSVLHQDENELVLNAIKEFSSKKATASDLGCGIGHFTQHLSPLFKSIHAVDLSQVCIERAREKCSAYSNINFETMDLSQPKKTLKKTDFVLCVNAIITDDLMIRVKILDTVCRSLKKGGHLVLVVPSLESALLTDARLIEWNVKKKSIETSKTHSGVSIAEVSDNARMHEGIVKLDSVDTKHYLKEELQFLLESRGMNILKTEKISYPWNTEFTEPPKWMKEPYPWDWLCVDKKVS